MSEMQPTFATPPETGGEDKKRSSLSWIPATLGIGLLIAAIYLGARIVTAHRSVQAAVRSTNTVPPQPARAPVAPPVVIAAAAEVKQEIKAERSIPVVTDDAV